VLLGTKAQAPENLLVAMICRGHAVAVVVVPGALPFMKQAVTRYADEATAEAIDYITVDLGTLVRTRTNHQHPHSVLQVEVVTVSECVKSKQKSVFQRSDNGWKSSAFFQVSCLLLSVADQQTLLHPHCKSPFVKIQSSVDRRRLQHWTELVHAAVSALSSDASVFKKPDAMVCVCPGKGGCAQSGTRHKAHIKTLPAEVYR
jgi:hypothetical protein